MVGVGRFLMFNDINDFFTSDSGVAPGVVEKS